MISCSEKFVLCFLLALWFVPSSHPQNNDNRSFEIAADYQDFPEGPAWDGKGILYVSNCYGKWITAVSRDTAYVFLKASDQPFTFKQTNGLTVYKDGNLFACDYGIGAILKITPQGESEIYSDGFSGKRFNRPNDLAFDKDGNLYFTDPKSYGSENRDGRVFRIENRTRKVEVAADSLAFPNGIAFSADGKSVFVCESANNRVLKYRAASNGKLINKEVFVTLPGGDPDGIAFDVQGNLYVAHFGGSAVYIVSPDGKVKEKITAPGKKPSNLEFAGDDLKTLFITEDETNSVYRLRVDIPGLPLFSSPVERR